MSTTAAERMGWFRAGVGVALIAAPGAVLQLSNREQPSGTAVLLLRTIGVRDLALGLGVVAATRSGEPADVRRWTLAALTSDGLDLAVGVAGRRFIGVRDAAAAAGTALVAVLGDVRALRSLPASAG